MHKRSPTTRSIPLKDLKVDPGFVSDPNLVKTYIALHQGKVKSALTRLPAKLIHTGFYVRRSDGVIEHISNLSEFGVPQLQSIIRSGGRPTLDLQWSPHAPDGGGYVCADDEVTLAAYRALGISMVPCRVLRPIAQPGPEAAIWLEGKDERTALAKTVPPSIVGYASFFGDKQICIEEALEELIAKCVSTSEGVRSFHQDYNHDVHYHEMLHALTRRHARVLDSILKLVRMGRQEHAIGLFRMAYEAFLNFYFDWIAPEFFGPRLQLLSALRNSDSSEESVDNSAWEVLCNFPGLLENTSEKARLSPLGATFHKFMYPASSLVVHQSYRHLEFEASAFDDLESTETIFTEPQLVRYLDVLTAALLIRIRNDVGLD